MYEYDLGGWSQVGSISTASIKIKIWIGQEHPDSAPKKQSLLKKWFREKHNIHIEITTGSFSKKERTAFLGLEVFIIGASNAT
jgi:hypothetical protein